MISLEQFKDLYLERIGGDAKREGKSTYRFYCVHCQSSDNFAVSEAPDRLLMKCHSCDESNTKHGKEKILSMMGLKWKDIHAPKEKQYDMPSKRLSVEDLAAHMGVDVKMLRKLGYVDHRDGVSIRYILPDRSPAPRHKIRVKLKGDNRFKWDGRKEDGKIVPYIVDPDIAGKTVFLVEGESDVVSAYLLGYPAVGISGVDGVKSLTKEYIEGASRVYIVKESDTASDKFIRGLRDHMKNWGMKNIFIAHPVEGCKDVNDMYKAGVLAQWINNLGTDNPLFTKEPVDLTRFNDTDAGNAERLIAQFGDELRYCVELVTWLAWDGTRWVRDNKFKTERRCLRTIRLFRDQLEEKLKEAQARHEELLAKVEELKENKEATKEEKRAAVEAAKKAGKIVSAIEKRIKFAISSESKGKLRAMEEIGRTIKGVAIDVNELDQHPYLVNFKNGTYDLKTGVFREHRQEDFLTQRIEVNYDPLAEAPRWEKFVDEIMCGKEDMVSYLHMYLGYCLSGDTSEMLFPIAYGIGANGKSVLNDIVLHVMGEYALQASSDLVMSKKNQNGSLNPDLVQIRGKRMVFLSETTEGKSLDESLVKRITGKEPITCRDLYEKPFTFRPVAKYMLATNHKPIIKGTDNGIWRRVRLIGFENRFEGPKRDPYLEEKLINEAQGIINWMIKGFKMWEKNGLNSVESIMQATEEYRESMDSIGNFLKDVCVEREGARVSNPDLYAAYKQWCQDNGEHANSQRVFTNRLTDKGLVSKKINGVRRWINLAIDTSSSETSSATASESEKRISVIV
jgi:putative DNA primase/helicase